MRVLGIIALLVFWCVFLPSGVSSLGAQTAVANQAAQSQGQDSVSWKTPSLEDGISWAKAGYDWEAKAGDMPALVDVWATGPNGPIVHLQEGVECGATAVVLTLPGRLFNAGRKRARTGYLPLSSLEVAAFLAEHGDQLEIELTLPLQLPEEVHQFVVLISQEGQTVSSLQVDLRAATELLRAEDVLYRMLFEDNSCTYPYELNATLDLNISSLDPRKDFEISISTLTRVVTLAIPVSSIHY